MPYKSEKQRRYLHKKEPALAARWDRKYGGEVKKFVDRDKRLRHQKKASAVTSLVGGTAGLAGLGLLAARRPKGAAVATTISGGVGGVGAYNFASIQNQESKKRGPKQNVYVVRNKKQIKGIKSGLEPVTKGLDMMDFGLSDVHQGEAELVSKRGGESAASAAHDKMAHRRDTQANVAATAGGAGLLGAYGADVHAAIGAQKRTNFPRKYQGSLLKARAKEAVGGYKSARMGTWSPEFGKPIPRRKLVKPMATFAAKTAGQNKHALLYGAGLTAAAAGLGASIPLSGSSEKHKKASKQIRAANKKANPVGVAKRATWIPKTTKRVVGEGANQVNIKTRTAARNPLYRVHHKADYKYATGRHDTVGGGGKLTTAGKVTAGGVVTAGGGGTAYVATRKPKQETPEMVGKAYNPESKRQRRLEHEATALSVTSGALGAGALHQGWKARGTPKVVTRVPLKNAAGSVKATVKNSKASKKQKAADIGAAFKPRVKRQATGLKSPGIKGYKAGVKNARTATLLAAGAVGAGVASDQVRRYKSGGGKSYKPLSRITAS